MSLFVPGTAAVILGRTGDVLAWNDTARMLFPGRLPEPGTDPGPASNNVRYVFQCPEARSLFVDWAVVADDTVAHLRSAAGHLVDDPAVRALVEELTAACPEFAARWTRLRRDRPARHPGPMARRLLPPRRYCRNMTQPNPDAGQGQQPMTGPHGHYPAGPPIPPGHHHPYGAPPHHFQPGRPTRNRPGVKAIVAGVILLAGALVVLVLPFGLFILGGGGDTDRFEDMLRGFQIASAIFALLGLGTLTFGIVTAVISRRHRS